MLGELCATTAADRSPRPSPSRPPIRRGGSCRSRRIRARTTAVAGASHGRLLGEVIEIHLPEGAVVEPVVAHPAVDHRALGHGGLERRMRIDERHDDGEALVGAADHADAAVRLGHVLHKPVDRVVGVGGVIDACCCSAVRAAGASSRTRLPTRISRARPGRRGCSRRRQTARRTAAAPRPCSGDAVALRARRRVVRRPREQDGRVARALRHDDDRVELDAVAHRDHDVALRRSRTRLSAPRSAAGCPASAAASALLRARRCDRQQARRRDATGIERRDRTHWQASGYFLAGSSAGFTVRGRRRSVADDLG